MPDNIHPVEPPKLGHFSLLPGSQQALVFAVSSYVKLDNKRSLLKPYLTLSVADILGVPS
jgi:hypothetical protein